MSLLRLPVRQGTDEWLAARRTGITASDLPIITGNRPGLLERWAIKSGLMEEPHVDDATQEMYDLGHALEPVIADAYTRKTGRPVKAVAHMVRHPDIEWAYASLDRVSAVRGERRIVELKWAPHSRWADGPEPVPAAVQDQVQWQLFVTGFPVADVAVLTGARVEPYEMRADPEYQADLLTLASLFRADVMTGTRPAIDGTDSTRHTLTRLHPREAGVIRAPSTEMDDLARQLHRAKREAKDAADLQASIENAIRAVVADAPGVEGDGYRITWTRNRDTSKTDWRLVAKSYRALLGGIPDDLDAIESLYSTTQEGPRVLRVTYKEEAGSWL